MDENTNNSDILAFGAQNSSSQGDSVGNVSPTLDKSKVPGIHNNVLVRRLTPLECERLQGFPDGYTDIPDEKPYTIQKTVKGRLVSKTITMGRIAIDSKRYQALGNSMTTNVMAWIGERIQMVEEEILGIKLL